MGERSSAYRAGLQKLHEELHTMDKSTVSNSDLGQINHDEDIIAQSLPTEGTHIANPEPVEPEPQVYTEAEQREILDINSYGGVYGRLLLASQSQETEVRNIINPAIKGNIEPSQITISPERNYNPITRKLSSDERIAAWKGIEFNEAYRQWRTKLTEAIKSTTDKKRIEAIAVISGKLASEFNEEDTDNLYNAFCKEKSDTTTFAKSIVANLQKDGNVDLLKIMTLSSGIEWFSGNFFGKQTAVTVSRIIELEAEIANNPATVVQKLFSDKERINNLTDTETEILTHLYGGLYAAKIEIEPQEHESEPTQAEEATVSTEPASSRQTARDDSIIDSFFVYLEKEKTQEREDVSPAPLSEVAQTTQPFR